MNYIYTCELCIFNYLIFVMNLTSNEFGVYLFFCVLGCEGNRKHCFYSFEALLTHTGFRLIWTRLTMTKKHHQFILLSYWYITLFFFWKLHQLIQLKSWFSEKVKTAYMSKYSYMLGKHWYIDNTTVKLLQR